MAKCKKISTYKTIYISIVDGFYKKERVATSHPFFVRINIYLFLLTSPAYVTKVSLVPSGYVITDVLTTLSVPE